MMRRPALAWQDLHTSSKLDYLAEQQARREVQAVDLRQALAALEAEARISLPDLFAAIDAGHAQLAALAAEAIEQDGALMAAIRQDVLDGALAVVPDAKGHVDATVRGARLMAVYTAGRETVSIADFRVYAKFHPEVLPLIKRGEPSVSIRPIAVK